jgi:ATP-dependent protease ClpP protease subunit
MRDRTVDVDNAVPLPEFDMEWEKGVPYRFGDLVIVIEHLAGETRTKQSSGYTVSTTFPVAYGCILRTTDAHGDEIDMYLASMATPGGNVFVIDQVNLGTGTFDEHKIMLGFSSPEEAAHLYCSVFADNSGSQRLGAITTFTDESLAAWLVEDGSALKPASESPSEGRIPMSVSGIRKSQNPGQGQPLRRDETGGVVIDLPNLSAGPKIVTKPNGPDSFDYHIYLTCAFTMDTWSGLVDIFCRKARLATERDTFHFHIASPGGSVLLMGRVISAINITKAKVITYAEGSVASAALAIWSSGHERHIAPGAYFMQHMSSQLLGGKTTDIAAKAIFAVNYIETRLQRLVESGLFTKEEVNDMVEKSADIFNSGRTTADRVGVVSHSV